MDYILQEDIEYIAQSDMVEWDMLKGKSVLVTGATGLIGSQIVLALDRTLKQISDYSCRLNIDEGNPEKKSAEFINFLPVIAYDGSTMQQVDAGEILDIAMAGTCHPACQTLGKCVACQCG